MNNKDCRVCTFFEMCAVRVSLEKVAALLMKNASRVGEKIDKSDIADMFDAASKMCYEYSKTKNY